MAYSTSYPPNPPNPQNPQVDTATPIHGRLVRAVPSVQYYQVQRTQEEKKPKLLELLIPSCQGRS